MGYYAHSMNAKAFTINNPTAVLDHLATTEREHGHSWCYPVAHYRALTNNDSTALREMVESYGFHCSESDDGQTVVESFGDTKIGGSHESFWEAFAQGTEDEVCWLMYGEDGEMWAEVITTDGYRQCQVEVSHKVII